MRAGVIHSPQFGLCKRTVTAVGSSHTTNKAHDRMWKNWEYGCLERLCSCEAVIESNKRCRPLCALHIIRSASYGHQTAGQIKAEDIYIDTWQFYFHSAEVVKNVLMCREFLFLNYFLSLRSSFAPPFFAVQLVTVNNQMNNLHDNWKIWERRCFYMGDLVVWQCLNWMKGGSMCCSLIEILADWSQ